MVKLVIQQRGGNYGEIKKCTQWNQQQPDGPLPSMLHSRGYIALIHANMAMYSINQAS